MKQLLGLSVVMLLGACTVSTGVPKRVTIDADKVVIYHDGQKHRPHHQYDKDKRKDNHYKKGHHCPYGQAKKGRCDY